MNVRARTTSAVLGIVCTVAGCAAAISLLRDVLQAPVFEAARDRPAELRLLGPSAQRPLGGASIRLYAHVSNPNPLGLTLSQLAGSLFLEGTQAAQVNFPLGVPLQAQGDAVVPLDISLSFSDLPNLAGVAQRALTGSPLAYRLNGSVTVDAGALGRPSFGPMNLLEGSVRPFR
jgi:hypothetical protein